MTGMRATVKLKERLLNRSPLQKVGLGILFIVLATLSACTSEGTPQGQPTLSDLASEVRLEGAFGEVTTGSFEFGNSGGVPLEYSVAKPEGGLARGP